MSDTAVRRAELIVGTIARTAVENEKYFCDLDAVAGDGDFGYSLARGFENVISGWDELEYEDAGGLLKKTAIILTKRIGGTSGPIWGTAFLRAGGSLAGKADPTGADVVEAMRAAIEGIKQRGNTDLGDKTLLDALVPATDTLEANLGEGRRDRARARGRHRARERGGHEGHARHARARVLHGRAQPRLGRRRSDRRRGALRGRRKGVARGGAGTGLMARRCVAGTPQRKDTT